MKTARLLVILIGIGGAAWWLIWGCAEESHQLPTSPVSPLGFIDTTYPHDDALDVPLGTVVSFSCTNKTAKLTPAGLLYRNAEYEIVIDSGIADTFGNVMKTLEARIIAPIQMIARALNLVLLIMMLNQLPQQRGLQSWPRSMA